MLKPTILINMFYARANSARHTSGVILTPEKKEKVVDTQLRRPSALSTLQSVTLAKDFSRKFFFEEVRFY